MKWISKPPLGIPLNWAHRLNKGLVGFWLFNEGMGDKVQDLSMNRNHGTLTNMAFPPTTASGWNPSRKGKGLQFDGANDSVVHGNAASLDFGTGNVTFSARVKTTQSDVWVSVVEKNSNGIIVNSGAAGFQLWDGTNNPWLTTNELINDNYWHQIVAVRANGIYLYLNGSLKKSGTDTTGNINTGVTLQIGSDNSSAYFNGLIDEVRIWNRALSASEVQELYINPYGMFL